LRKNLGIGGKNLPDRWDGRVEDDDDEVTAISELAENFENM
jgi:hypothetical protein